MSRVIVPALTLAAALSIGLIAVAAAHPQAEALPRARLGDLMTNLIQPRHTKLGLGGQAHNWQYAAYEWSELNAAFKTVETRVPRYHDVAMTDWLQMVRPPMEELAAAIKAKDAAQFDAAYSHLTDGCNACHQSTDHAVIVIQSPSAAMFPDQNFAPRTQ
ncbi:hypothetical protein SAMN02745126_00497 [Enhydrobacter aerosaccus]|uniref:Cytochrome C n=1 Tax=Enhydrobacter aerosaccus TaxID=225324 RepID=A0A1T4JV08_9HYPH|nr:hypothetical protein [Enhydrobacter aerosaccus]SJZ34062.1 hypothetical protein SAMN02745126_00497 [Enhydrobacter aerosaccus]